MADLERRYAGRAEFVLLYTREFNPGLGRFRDLKDPDTLEGRLALARRLKQDFDLAGRHPVWLVDSMANRLHQAYGSPKGASIVVDRGGRVAFKGAWASPQAVDQALAPLVARNRPARSFEADFFVSLEPPARPPPSVDPSAGLWMDAPAREPLERKQGEREREPRAPAPAARAPEPVVAAPPAPPAGASVSRTFVIGGMVCQGCAISIREAVNQVPLVTGATLAYRPGAPGELRVETAPGADPAAIRSAIERTGFSVLSGPTGGERR